MTSSKPGAPYESYSSSERVEGVKEFVGKVSENLHELELDGHSHKELEGHISTVQTQLGSDEPEHSLVDDALEAMQKVLGVSNTQRATELLAEAGRFLTGVG